MASDFKPEWAIPVGYTLREHCRENGISMADCLAGACLSEEVLDGLLDGTAVVTEEVARQLDEFTGILAELWCRWDTEFRTLLAQGVRVSQVRWLEFEATEAVSGWTGAVNVIIYRRDRPESFSGQDLAPPCPQACNQAIEACHALVGSGLKPTMIEQGEDGDIEIRGANWSMHFQESENPNGERTGVARRIR